MPAIKSGAGTGRSYAEDAAGAQRLIHRLSKDEDAPRDFVKDCIADLSRVVDRINRHLRDQAESPPKKTSSSTERNNGSSKKKSSSKSTATARSA